MRHRLFTAAVIVVGSSLSSSTFGQTLNPGNGHYYRQITGANVNWFQARAAAEALTFQGQRGYLASITTASEQSFIETNLQFTGVGFGIYIGGFQPAGSAEPNGGWTWISGEPFVYRSPFFANNSGDENVIELSDAGRGNWNDIAGTAIRQSYLVEFNAIPEPSSAILVGLGAMRLLGRRRLV